MRCPFGDQWALIDDIARGKTPWNVAWLFSQHNEHRLVIPRFLTWLDVTVFHARNISLFVEIWLAMLLHATAICYMLERFTSFPESVKRTLQGVFTFCILHPSQYDNLTWAFQISFILAFTIATLAIVAAIYFPILRPRWLVTIWISAAPLLAAFNLSGGLLVGIILLCIVFAYHLPERLTALISLAFLLSSGLYLWHLQLSDPAHSLSAALRDPKGILVYILTYFGASWTRILPHKERPIALLSLLYLAYILIGALRRSHKLSSFEWFCVSECGFLILVALATALGRLHFGVGQAFASRYQTPAMLYWASLGALALIAAWRRWPARFSSIQTATILLMLLSVYTFPKIWQASISWQDPLKTACAAVIQGTYDQQTAKTLYANINGLEPGASFLRHIWRDRRTNGK